METNSTPLLPADQPQKKTHSEALIDESITESMVASDPPSPCAGERDEPPVNFQLAVRAALENEFRRIADEMIDKGFLDVGASFVIEFKHEGSAKVSSTVRQGTPARLN